MTFSNNIEILQSRITNYSMKIFEHERKQRKQSEQFGTITVLFKRGLSYGVYVDFNVLWLFALELLFSRA